MKIKGLFVHDHRFPKNGVTYYNSYGFDNEFFERYLSFFNRLDIIARKTELSANQLNDTFPVKGNVKFTTVNSYSELKNSDIRKNINKKIAESDYLIIRLPSILGLYALHKAKKLKKPYLIELVGCPWDAYWNQNIFKKIFAPFITLITKKAVKNGKYIVYVTEDFLQKRYPTNGKSIACSNVTIPNVKESVLKKRIRKIENSNLNEEITVGTIATLDATYKGQDYMIKNILKLNSLGYKIKYQLVGGGDYTFLKKIARKNGVENQVIFLGKLKHEDIFTWLDSIDIYIQPSLTEGLPRAVIEAMSRACPILGSNAGGIPELLNNDFIFQKGDLNSLNKTFQKFTIESMKNQAIINHMNSKKYLKSILYERRMDFLFEFTQKN